MIAEMLRSRGTKRGRTPGGSLRSLLFFGGLVSLLIWGKLRLVSNVPRTAYAEPDPALHAPPEPEPASLDPADPGAAGQAHALTAEDRLYFD